MGVHTTGISWSSTIDTCRVTQRLLGGLWTGTIGKDKLLTQPLNILKVEAQKKQQQGKTKYHKT